MFAHGALRYISKLGREAHKCVVKSCAGTGISARKTYIRRTTKILQKPDVYACSGDSIRSDPTVSRSMVRLSVSGVEEKAMR